MTRASRSTQLQSSRIISFRRSTTTRPTNPRAWQTVVAMAAPAIPAPSAPSAGQEA